MFMCCIVKIIIFMIIIFNAHTYLALYPAAGGRQSYQPSSGHTLTDSPSASMNSLYGAKGIKPMYHVSGVILYF